MNMEVAWAAFEQNPFRWTTRGWQSQVEVAFFWSWCGSDGAQNKTFAFAQLHHVFARQVPRPVALVLSDADLWRRLTNIASSDTQLRKAPCKYLGVEIRKGKYEPDPAKWPARCYPQSQGKTKANVHFEWEHVLCEGSPHRVSESVHNLLHHQQPVPYNPLKASTCSGLKFTAEFMEAVAKNVREGVRFMGLAFQQERAQLVLQLPDDGVDIQNEPVYWMLPDGRCKSWSVRDLASAPEHELVHVSEETLNHAYDLVAWELH